MTDARLRRGRISLGVGFLTQGVTFALLVTRIPTMQDRYGISDGLLPVFLAAVPVLAGVGSVLTEKVVTRVRPAVVLRCVQPLVMLSLLAVGAGTRLWQAVLFLGVFGIVDGSLDASMNMLGVGLQRACGRSIMLGFHAAYSLGGIVGASLAWAGAHWDLALFVSYLPAVVVLLPATLVAGRWYVGDEAPADRVPGATPEDGVAEPPPSRVPGVVFRMLLPLCLVMAFAYVGDSTVSNWSAKYLQDTLGSSAELATVPYNAYMVTTLLGRAFGDFGVRRFGPVPVVRVGALLAAAGFAVVAVAPGPWTGILGFMVLGFGLCVLVPQCFAAAGRMFPGASDAAVARLNIFNYVGFLVGSPLVGALGDVWSYRGAMLVPMVMVLVTLTCARSFARVSGGYGDGHDGHDGQGRRGRPRIADVG